MCWDRWESLSKLGGAHRIRMELMAQLQEPRSRSIETRFAMLPGPLQYGSTSGRGPVPVRRVTRFEYP